MTSDDESVADTVVSDMEFVTDDEAFLGEGEPSLCVCRRSLHDWYSGTGCAAFFDSDDSDWDPGAETTLLTLTS